MITLHLNDDTIKSLSRHELNILKYVYEHTEEILSCSIQDFSKQVAYSTATVLRFCRKLGYSGFAEFKYALRAELRSQLSETTTQESHSYTSGILIDRLSSNIQATANLIREEQLNQTFRYFDSNCAIYIWTPGGITAIVTEYFEKLLFSIGRQDVYRIESSKMFEHILRNLDRPAVMVVISTSGNFGPSIRLGKLARMKGIPVISITPYTSNEIADLATVNFRFFTDQRENAGAEFTSRLPIFFIINTIIQCYLKYRHSICPLPKGDSRDTNS